MKINELVSQLRNAADSLASLQTLLTELSDAPTRTYKRRKKTRTLSTAARRKLSNSMKKMWHAKRITRKRTLHWTQTPEGRAKQSARMRAQWKSGDMARAKGVA